MASQESEESVDEDDVCAHRIGVRVLMAPVKREDVRANVVRSRIGDRSIDLRVVAGHSVHVVLAFLPLALLWVLMKSSPPLPIIIIWVLMKSSPRLRCLPLPIQRYGGTKRYDGTKSTLKFQEHFNIEHFLKCRSTWDLAS